MYDRKCQGIPRNKEWHNIIIGLGGIGCEGVN
jgi:hypothetical protein